MPVHISAPLPADLVAEMDALVRRIRAADDARRHRDEGIDLILRLTDAGLRSFFLRPVEVMNLGVVARKATEVGLRTASGAIGVFIRSLGRGFDDAQVRALADLLDEMVVEVPDDDELDA